MNPYFKILPKKRLENLYRIYRRGYSINELAEIFGLTWHPIWSGFHRHGFKVRKQCCGRKRIQDSFIAEMHADYELPMSLAAVARKYNRDRRALHELFQRRGFALRPCDNGGAKDPETGQFIPYTPKTAAEINAIVARMTKPAIPAELRLEWRKWSIAKRGDFISRIRSRVLSDKDRPTTSFSSNVEPFDYATPRARAIAEKANKGLGSRHAVVKIDLCSQGVIYRDRLWFWSPKTGYQIGPWTPGEGRPVLHHVIWEKTHGRKVARGCVVRFADGNPNNFEPANLTLATRNEVARENQAAALLRKSREVTSLLLKRSRGKQKYGYTTTVEALKAA